MPWEISCIYIYICIEQYVPRPEYPSFREYFHPFYTNKNHDLLNSDTEKIHKNRHELLLIKIVLVQMYEHGIKIIKK